MHLHCLKCILAVQKCIWCVHFPKENVRVHFPKENVQLCKNAFDAKMHLMCQKCIWCIKCILASQNAFLHQMHLMLLTFCLQNVRKRQNAFWRTFSKGKCSATLCKNAFDAKMHLMRCQNAFLHQMHFGNAYILLCKMFSITFSNCKMFSITFYFVKCSASHFPKENVQQPCLH